LRARAVGLALLLLDGQTSSQASQLPQGYGIAQP
jgi:hypothetical protein